MEIPGGVQQDRADYSPIWWKFHDPPHRFDEA